MCSILTEPAHSSTFIAHIAISFVLALYGRAENRPPKQQKQCEQKGSMPPPVALIWSVKAPDTKNEPKEHKYPEHQH
jgi:hypothetical protein